jgi:hypothetical protein
MLWPVQIEVYGGSRVIVDSTIFMLSHYMALQVLADVEPLLLLGQVKAEAARLAEEQFAATVLFGWNKRCSPRTLGWIVSWRVFWYLTNYGYLSHGRQGICVRRDWAAGIFVLAHPLSLYNAINCTLYISCCYNRIISNFCGPSTIEHLSI